ncbi:McrC family protein [Halalkalirubrum salinum]|uniref:McrC family protein n=1 Tax=Halalkalirubrum salinum TaxID=2563889 RepID=UPI0014859B21|nr:hypothetical protein [Halalkalirubrum salinum]
MATERPNNVPHTVELSEHDRVETDILLTDTDRRFIETHIEGPDGPTPLKISYNSDGGTIFKSQKFVGIVSLPDGPTIRIQPKAAGDNLLYLLRYSQGIDPQTVDQDVQLRGGDSFIDALAALFCQEVQTILHRGLHSEYERVETREPQLRGQLDVHTQIRRQHPFPTKFECVYDELTQDTVANQAILYATSVLQRMTTDESLKRDLRWYNQRLQKAVTFRPVRSVEVEALRLNRLNEYYTDILRLVRPILQNSYLDSLHDGGVSSFSFFMNMSHIFEAVIGRAIERIAQNADNPHWAAYEQKKTTSLLHGGTPPVTVKPDFVLEASGQPLVVGDSKWKTPSSNSKSIRNSDLYQMVSYCIAHDTPGLLVYPEQGGHIETSYTIESGHSLDVYELPTGQQTDSYEAYTNQLERSLETKINSLVEAM